MTQRIADDTVIDDSKRQFSANDSLPVEITPIEKYETMSGEEFFKSPRLNDFIDGYILAFSAGPWFEELSKADVIDRLSAQLENPNSSVVLYFKDNILGAFATMQCLSKDSALRRVSESVLKYTKSSFSVDVLEDTVRDNLIPDSGDRILVVEEVVILPEVRSTKMLIDFMHHVAVTGLELSNVHNAQYLMWTKYSGPMSRLAHSVGVKKLYEVEANSNNGLKVEIFNGLLSDLEYASESFANLEQVIKKNRRKEL